jgi:hypothetical protein
LLLAAIAANMVLILDGAWSLELFCSTATIITTLDVEPTYALSKIWLVEDTRTCSYSSTIIYAEQINWLLSAWQSG